MYHIFGGGSAQCETAGHYLTPDVDIVFRVSAYDRLARGSRGSVCFDDFVHGYCKHTEWIIITEICFRGEREFFDILYGGNMAGFQA